MKKDSVLLELLVFILSIATILLFLQRSSLREDIEDLESQLEELQSELAIDYECHYCGTHEYEYVFCDYCDYHIPAEFAYQFNGENVCPDCIYGAYDEMVSNETGRCYKCGSFYYLKWSSGFGLCDECDDDMIVECIYCFTPTYEWPGTFDETVCPNCLAEANESTNLGDLLEEFNENR